MTDTQAPESHAPQSLRQNAPLLAVACVAVAALAAALWPKPNADLAQIAAFQTRLGQIETRVDAMDNGLNDVRDTLSTFDSQNAMRDAQMTVGANPALAERLEALEQRVQSLNPSGETQTREQVVTLRNDVATLRGELDNAIKQTSHGGRQLKLLIAYYRLRDLILSGNPYRDELAKVDYFTSPDSSIDGAFDTLRPYADSGVPTPDILKEDFEEAARAAVSGIAADASPTLADRIKGNLSHLITVRRTDGADDDMSDDAIIARAETQLEEHNVAEAIKELATLSPAGKNAFAEWLDDANNYLTVRETVDQLDRAILDRIADQNEPAAGDEAP